MDRVKEAPFISVVKEAPFISVVKEAPFISDYHCEALFLVIHINMILHKVDESK